MRLFTCIVLAIFVAFGQNPNVLADTLPKSEKIIKIPESKLRLTILKLKERRLALESCTQKLALIQKSSKKVTKICLEPAKKPTCPKCDYALPFVVGFLAGGVLVGLSVGLIVKAVK